MDLTKNKKRSPVTNAEGSIMGNLQEHLIDSILERLPIQDIIRTSILSKKWRYKWTTMRSLVFDEQICKKLGKYGAFGRRGVISVINRVLLLHEGSISKFYLYIPNMRLHSFQEVDQWMLFLSTKGVKDLTIANSNHRRYQHPFCVFSCLELRNLELSNCIFKPPLQFQGFLYLESLTLIYIDFTTNLGGTVINVPELKKLSMHSCTNVCNLKLKATKLQTLSVINCPDVVLLELLHSQDLAFVCITLEKPIQDLVRLKRMDLALMFTKMPKVQRFFIDSNFLQVFIAEKPKWLWHRVDSLKHLQLNDFSLGDLDHLHGVLCLLRNSPNLETLCMMNIRMESKSMHNGVEATSDHLESPDCLDQTFNQLQSVELSPLKGSKPELLFIKLLLAHSPSLEKFTITPHGNLDANKRLNIAKDVMRFPRASSKAEMVYLDPKPCWRRNKGLRRVQRKIF